MISATRPTRRRAPSAARCALSFNDGARCRDAIDRSAGASADRGRHRHPRAGARASLTGAGLQRAHRATRKKPAAATASATASAAHERLLGDLSARSAEPVGDAAGLGAADRVPAAAGRDLLFDHHALREHGRGVGRHRAAAGLLRARVDLLADDAALGLPCAEHARVRRRAPQRHDRGAAHRAGHGRQRRARQVCRAARRPTR